MAVLLLLASCGGDSSSPAETRSGITIVPDDGSAPPESPAPDPTVPPPAATPTPVPTPIATPTPAFDPGTVILPTVVPTFTPTPVLDEQEALANRMDAINLKINVFRGLGSIDDVNAEFISRDEAGSRIREDFADHNDELLKTERLYRALGILDEDDDLYEIRLSLLDEGVLGFYDTDEDTLYVVGEESGLSPSQSRVYVHEFVHGLQDQHFDISAIRESLAGNTDRKNAFRALVEGDATVSELVFINQDMSEEEREASVVAPGDDLLAAFREAPRVVQREYLFPYQEGAQFVIQMYGTAGFEAIDQAYENLPQSTEQILHPEKYESGESPIEVAIADPSAALGDGWSLALEDTLGEFLLQAYLEPFLGTQLAVAAADGWGGDTALLLDGPDGETVLLLRAIWDTESDAVEFGNAFAQATEVRVGETWETLDEDVSALLIKPPDQVIFFTTAVDTTFAIFAPDEAVLNSVRAALQ